MCRIFDMPLEDLLTTGQIAEQLKVDRTTVDYWIRTGKLTPAQVANGIRLFHPDDVARFGEARALLKGGPS